MIMNYVLKAGERFGVVLLVQDYIPDGDITTVKRKRRRDARYLHTGKRCYSYLFISSLIMLTPTGE